MLPYFPQKRQEMAWKKPLRAPREGAMSFFGVGGFFERHCVPPSISYRATCLFRYVVSTSHGFQWDLCILLSLHLFCPYHSGSWVFVGYEDKCTNHPFCAVNMKEVTYGNVISPSMFGYPDAMKLPRLNYRVLWWANEKTMTSLSIFFTKCQADEHTNLFWFTNLFFDASWTYDFQPSATSHFDEDTVWKATESPSPMAGLLKRLSASPTTVFTVANWRWNEIWNNCHWLVDRHAIILYIYIICCFFYLFSIEGDANCVFIWHVYTCKVIYIFKGGLQVCPLIFWKQDCNDDTKNQHRHWFSTFQLWRLAFSVQIATTVIVTMFFFEERETNRPGLKIRL